MRRYVYLDYFNEVSPPLTVPPETRQSALDGIDLDRSSYLSTHGDLLPKNIMVDFSVPGRPRITGVDFFLELAQWSNWEKRIYFLRALKLTQKRLMLSGCYTGGRMMAIRSFIRSEFYYSSVACRTL